MSLDLATVKVVCKISSAMNNFDKLYSADGNKEFFSGKLCRSFTKFFEFAEHHTAIMTEEMYAMNSESFSEAVYYHLDGVDLSLSREDEDSELGQICLMVSKLLSASKDLGILEKNIQYNLFAKPLVDRLDTMLTKGFIKRLPVKDGAILKLTEIVTTTADGAIIE